MQPDDDKTQAVAVISKGTVVGHYRIVEKIGAGGMGEVYLASDTSLDRDVALKFLPIPLLSNRDCVARFKREAQAAAKLNHPNIVTIHEVGEYNGRPYFAMEYVKGGTLRELIDTAELPLGQTIEFASQICEGLHKAHQAGVVHRDIKPGNVLIDTDGPPKICDFGLAAIAGCEPLTKAGSILGTFSYMSPEQVRGEEPDQRSDIFSVGVVLYEMLAGVNPFKGANDGATLHNIIDSQPELSEKVRGGAELHRIVGKALSKSKQDRHQSACEFALELRGLVTASSLSKSPTAITLPNEKGVSVAIVLVSLATFLIVAVIAGLLWSNSTILRKAKNWAGIDVVPATKHLAVLPFFNVGENTENQAFCDGLLETMTSKLSQLEQFHGSLWIVPATEVRQRGTTSVADARRAFGITLAVTGSVQRIGDQVRVTLNLVDATTNRQLDAEMIDNNLSNVSAIQDSTVLRLVEMLEIESRPEQERFLLAGRTGSGAAYDLYLQGRGLLQRFEQANTIDTAIALFRRALSVDSQYASAHAGLGEAYWRKYEAKKDTALVALARTNCQRALDLDSHLIEAHLTMGLIRFGTGLYEEAISEYRGALTLDSTSYAAYRGLAKASLQLRRPLEAENYFKKAIAMKPDYWLGYRDLGAFYLNCGRYDEAIDQLKVVVRLLPEDYRAWSDLGAYYYQLDRVDDASRAWSHSLVIEPNYGAYSNLGSLNFLEGRFVEAAQMFERALQLDSSDYAVWGNLAMADQWIPEKRNDCKLLIARAIQMAEQQRAVNPRISTLLTDLALYYAISGEGSKGQSILEEALKLAPDNNDIMASAGVFYQHLGKTDSALIYIRMALEHGYPLDQILKLPEVREMQNDPRFARIVRPFEGKSQNH